MKRFIAMLLVLSVAGCKGETVIKPDPNTESELDKCKKDRDDLTAYKKKLEAENADLMNRGSGGGEIVVTIEGDLVKPIKGSLGGTGVAGEPNVPVDPKAAIAFQNVVEKSRGAIQKCYEQALKKNSTLRVTLTVMASFTATGAYRQASFQPSLGDAFDNCMQSIATHWNVPTNSPSMTFRAQVQLTPS
jgi:hypothetical protein|nr:hypothetical protein [Kofleriaceae bacterium]